MAVNTGIKIYRLGERLEEISADEEILYTDGALYITNSLNLSHVFELTGMNFEGEASLKDVGFSKVEVQQECLWGSLFIPNLVDVMDSRHRVIFFLNQTNIVLLDDYDFSKRITGRIMSRRIHQADTKEKFLCNFLTEIINGDQAALSSYEKNLMALEERIVENRISHFQNTIVPLRNELLILQGYYDELRDLGKELEEDENGFFDKKMRKYFGVFSDRADRLMNKAAQLLEYAKQIKADYETAITAKQNTTMQFLTIISTIFMPLTLITSWYGMNFKNMPELEGGYPFVIVLCLAVIIITLIIFKKKKLL